VFLKNFCLKPKWPTEENSGVLRAFAKSEVWDFLVRHVNSLFNLSLNFKISVCYGRTLIFKVLKYKKNKVVEACAFRINVQATLGLKSR